MIDDAMVIRLPQKLAKISVDTLLRIGIYCSWEIPQTHILTESEAQNMETVARSYDAKVDAKKRTKDDKSQMDLIDRMLDEVSAK